jgi:Fe-S oxidoreductase
VFYFPGCGSERLYADIAAAAIYSLVKSGIRVIIPPLHQCCGFPAKVNAKKKMAAISSLRDTIILSQIREMLGHLVFDGFVVSCGTCREALHEMGCGEIFACDILDVSQFVLDNGALPVMAKRQETVLYHTPCHDSIDGMGKNLLGRLVTTVKPVADCCSEAGTLAVSRPDIADAMRRRKRQSLERAMLGERTTTIATNCPSCLSGLGRNRDLGIMPQHIAVLLAASLGGEQWRGEFASLAARAERVTF